MWEHTEESCHSAFMAFKSWVRDLAVLNEIMFCGVLLRPALWGGLVTPLLAMASCYFGTSAVVRQPQQTKISGNDAGVYWGKRDQLRGCFACENVTSYSYLIPCGKPLLIWLCDRHLRPPQDLPLSPCQLMAKHRKAHRLHGNKIHAAVLNGSHCQLRSWIKQITWNN